MSDGLKNKFYEIPAWVKDVDDLAEYLELSFDEGNILKSLWSNKGKRHSGTNSMREANKCYHYAQRRKLRYEKIKKEKI
jgi:hypothetical protein